MITPAAAAAAAAGVGPDPLAAALAAADDVAATLDGVPPDLVIAFVGGGYADAFAEVAEAIAERLAPAHSIGATAGGVIAGDAELEHPQALALWAAVLPAAELTPLRFPPPAPAATGRRATWPEPPEDAVALITLADPATFAPEPLLSWLSHVRPGLPVSGGMASAAPAAAEQLPQNRLLLDGTVHSDGAVAIALGGAIRIRTLVSQGCRPVGPALTVTGANGNLVTELAGTRPARRLQELYDAADDDDKALLRRGLHIGLAIDEYREELGHGDFLIRGVLGAQRETGAVAVGDRVDVGRTVRFHVRDAASADADLRKLLDDEFDADSVPLGALLFSCNGRGARLFDEPDHDARIVSDFLGGAPLAGFFAAGELGPVGRSPRSYLHAFSASLLVVDAAEP